MMLLSTSAHLSSYDGRDGSNGSSASASFSLTISSETSGSDSSVEANAPALLLGLSAGPDASILAFSTTLAGGTMSLVTLLLFLCGSFLCWSPP
eukprot:402234-Prorocentrum_minimum.AAC.1